MHIRTTCRMPICGSRWECSSAFPVCSLNRTRPIRLLMPAAKRPILVVVSPFIDKKHGTERCIAEQIKRLSHAYEIHLYAERVQDVDLHNIRWHTIYVPPGPHVFRF